MTYSLRRTYHIACFIAAFLCASVHDPSHAQQADMTVNSIVISGNQRIESGTIETYLGVSRGDLVDTPSINQALKRLYETDFFADVAIDLDRNSGVLRVSVIENPSINQVAFEGNRAIDDDVLENEALLKSRSVFTRTQVQSDVARLLDVYRRSGHYSAVVEPKIITLEQNRIDLVYEIDEGPRTHIQNISFIGNDSYDSSTLRSVISSSEYVFYRFLSDSDIYDADRVEYDKELIRQFYRGQGYADFNVRSSFAEISPGKDGFYLTFVIDEGPKYTLGDVTIAGGKAEKRVDALYPLLTTKQGEFYNATAVQDSVLAMVDELGNLGFAFVDIDPKLERNKEEKTINLTYEISEGPRVYVERIDIEGNVRTLDEVIRREFRLAEGDPYNTEKLRRTEQRLTNLGYFENVSIETSPGSTPDRTVLDVEVQEQSTGEINLGAGFSTVDGALTDFGIRERNFLGRGQDLSFSALLSGQRQEFNVGFTEPYFLNRDLSAGFNLFKQTQDLAQEASFDRETVGGLIRIGYSLQEKLRHTIAYRLEEISVTDVDANASRFISDQEGTNITSMIGQSLFYDDRDNRFMPTDGWMLRLNQDIAGLGGDDYFLRHEAITEYYIPVFDQVTVLLGGSAGHIIPLQDDIRINHRFFIGNQRIRGFSNAGIGPRDINTRDALGGNTFYVGTAEVTFPLGLPNDFGIRGALFADAGSLWNVDDEGEGIVDENSTRISVGGGILWTSPFGPIRLDLASSIVREDFDETETFRIDFGTRF